MPPRLDRVSLRPPSTLTPDYLPLTLTSTLPSWESGLQTGGELMVTSGAGEVLWETP